MKPPARYIHISTAWIAIVIFAWSAATGCRCRRGAPSQPPAPPSETGAPLGLEPRRNDLETEARSRLQELERAERRMEARAAGIEVEFRPKWDAVMETLRENRRKVVERLEGLSKVDANQWPEFERQTRRALDDLDVLREDAEAYFKEKS